MAIYVCSNKTVFSFLLVLCAIHSVPSHPQKSPSDTDPNDDFYEGIRQLLAVKLAKQEAADDATSSEYESEIPEPHPATPPRPVLVKGWPPTPLVVGQITAVSINARGEPVIFHRGDRVWGYDDFNATHHYQRVADGPISADTVLTLDPASGAVLSSWGGGIFYMPHGLTVDPNGGVWVTDVALHQVFKFVPDEEFPVITIGARFQPGSDIRHLCQPTSVAVASAGGEVFVADGYCNSRVLEYGAQGRLIRVIPGPLEFLSLQVPHSLALLEHLDLLCIGDRENMRVVCTRAGIVSRETAISHENMGAPPVTIHQPDLGRVYAVAAHGDLVYAVNGPTSPLIDIQGFTIDPRAESIIDHWGPPGGFTMPHDIAICANGSALYVAEVGPNKLWKFDLVIDNEEPEHHKK